MLELKGQTGSGEWVEFEASSICRADKTYMIVWTGYDPYYELLLIETIQLADDPRKAMRAEIREMVVGIKSKNIAYGLVLKIIDEMEAKL